MSINAQLSRDGRWKLLPVWLSANPSVTFEQLGKGLSCRRKVGTYSSVKFCVEGVKILCGSCWFPVSAPVLASLKCYGTVELSGVDVKDAQCSMG